YDCIAAPSCGCPAEDVYAPNFDLGSVATPAGTVGLTLHTQVDDLFSLVVPAQQAATVSVAALYGTYVDIFDELGTTLLVSGVDAATIGNSSNQSVEYLLRFDEEDSF